MSEHAELMPATLEPLAEGDQATETLCEMLERSKLFGDVPREGLETLAKYTRAYRAPKDTALFASTPASCASS